MDENKIFNAVDILQSSERIKSSGKMSKDINRL